MVGAAKARLQAIEDQLHHARIDFEATQAANLKAARAARLAQSNAAAAAAHAAEIANAAHHHHREKQEHSEKIENNDEDDDHHDESVVINTRVDNNDKVDESELENKATQVLQQSSDATDYPTNLATLLAVSEDELYDSHDSFPY